jgi:hypothetical protein
MRCVVESLEERLLLAGSPTIYTVNSAGNSTTGTGKSGTLPYVIITANADTNAAGTEIVFDPTVFPATSTATITPTGSLTLSPAAGAGPEVIDGPGANVVTIDGSGNGGVSIFTVVPGGGAPTTISGLNLINGSAANGGAIANSGTLTLNSCAVSLSTAGMTGGGIENDNTLTATNCTIANDSAGASGGGIYNNANATLTMNACTVSGDSAANGGGVYNAGKLLTANNSTFSGNHALIAAGAVTGDGSGINNTGNLTLTNCTIANNTTIGTGVSPRGAGGGINNTSTGSMTAINCTIAGNTAAGAGGGINNSGLAALANTIVGTNMAGGGGPDVFGAVTTNSAYNLIGNGDGLSGIFNGINGNQVGSGGTPINPILAPLGNYGGLTQTMALLPGSPAIDAGSNVLASTTTDERGFSRITNGTVDIGALEVQIYIAYSTVPSGGGSLYTALTNANQAGGSVVLITATGLIGLTSSLPAIAQDVQILGPGANNLTVSGTGQFQIFNVQSGVTASIAGLTIDDGFSGTSGGGIRNVGTLSLANCTVSNSVATASGGGISNSSAGTITAVNCTIANNTAPSGGGIQNAGTFSLINCTIANNTTGAAGGNGGGIANTGMLSLSDCTVAGNSATTAGGGIYSAVGASTSVANTIVSTNAASSGSDVSGTVTNEQGSSLIGGNPVLGILQNNGGPTQTMALLPGSPAIGAGNVGLIPSGITTDQRGLPRTLHGKVDIGAFQSRGFSIVVSGGTPQQAVVNNFFPSPLFVTVSSPSGDPIQGGLVTYTAPASGPSAIFTNNGIATIDASGRAGIIAAANTIVGGPYTVTAAANGASGTGLSFSLTNLPVQPTQLVVHTQPASTAVAGQLFAPQPVVYVEDQFGNLATTDNSTKVTAFLLNTATALQTVTVVGGVATFTNLSYTKAGTIGLLFTAGTLTKATSNPITIKAASAVRFVLHIPNTGSFVPNTPYTISVLAQDAFGNQAGGYRGVIQFTSTKPATLPAVAPAFYTFTAADNGAHTFTNGLAFGQTGTVTITAYDINTPSITGSVTVGVSKGSAAKARVGTIKAKNRHLARKASSASPKPQAHAAVDLQSRDSSGANRPVVVSSGGPLHQTRAISQARYAAAVARADAARERILAQLRGNLRAYLATEKLGHVWLG